MTNIKFKAIIFDEKGNLMKGHGFITQKIIQTEKRKSKSYLWRKVS